MAEEKKKKPDEITELDEKKPEASGEEEKEKLDTSRNKPKDGEDKKPEEKAPDDNQADENGEGADKKPEDKESEDKPDDKAEEKSKAPETPELSETDQLKAENLTLKTQLEAMKIGFAPDCMEDAVILAEAIVKRDGVEIQEALQSVAKKYPDWKSDGKEKDKKSKAGFKVGADSSDNENASDDRLDQAFGIKKKK